MKAADRAYEWIKDAILSLRLAPGTFLNENEAAEGAGVSRTPVREAFLRLAGEGFLRIVPQRGAFIVPVGRREVEDVIAARLLVEIDAVRTVIKAGSVIADHVQPLLSAQSERAEQADWREFIDLDRRFHRAIVEGAGNDVITGFYDSLRNHQMRMGMVAVIRTRPRAAQIIEEHSAIARAVAAGDTQAAEAAVRAHLRFTQSCLLETNATDAALRSIS